MPFIAMILGKNILDIIFIIIILFFTTYSFFKGIVREIFSLLAITFGLIIAKRFYHQMAQTWGQWLHLKIHHIVAFILLFFAVYLVIKLTGMLFHRMIKKAKLSRLDHLGGAILGFIKGSFIVCLVLIILITVLFPHNKWLQTSKLSPYVAEVIYKSDKILTCILPQEIRPTFDKNMEKLKRFWKESHSYPVWKIQPKKPASEKELYIRFFHLFS